MRKFLLPLLLVAFFAFGVWAAYQFLNFGKTKEYTEADSTVILEKIEQVCKLVTVEGNFEERYDETNYREFTLYLPLPSTLKFSKSAQLRVLGTVLVGYDMEKIIVSADSTNKTITLSNFPDPEIIAIDHEVFYDSLDDSWFNSFNEKDFTALNKNAKKVLEQKAVKELLLEKAHEQGNQILDAINFMVNSAGWQLEVEMQSTLPTEVQPLN